jgi:hypothetical protein
MVTLMIINVALLGLAVVFVISEWKLSLRKIKERVLRAVGGLGRIGGGMTVTSVKPEANARPVQPVLINGKVVGIVVRGEGGSLKVVNPEYAPPARPEQPKQEHRPQQNHPHQNQNNSARHPPRRDDRRN